MVEDQQPSEPETVELSLEERDRREEGRVPVRFETEVRSLGEAYMAVVRDLSRWGFMAEGEVDFSVRSYVYLVLPGVGSLPGRVTWRNGSRFGANLLEPISTEHFERLIRVLPSGETEAAA